MRGLEIRSHFLVHCRSIFWSSNLNSFPIILQLLDFFPHFPCQFVIPVLLVGVTTGYTWYSSSGWGIQIAACISEKRKRDLMIRDPPSSFSSLCLSPLMHPTSEKTPFSHRKEAGEGAQFSPDWADKWRKEQVSTTITLYTVAKIRTFGVSR